MSESSNANTIAGASQFSLLKARRFLPFFITQVGGALNDNLFKNALAVIITYQAVQIAGLNSDQLLNASAVLFILPFFLFSAMVGQFADKFEKSRQIRYIKALEVFIMLLAVAGFYLDSFPLLLSVLFLLGTQSTLFSPLKFSLMPQILEPDELVGGNGLVETGTFIAILVGTAIGLLVGAIPDIGVWVIATICLSVAVIGFGACCFIPALPATDPDLKINWNPFSETWLILRGLTTNKTVFNSVLGMSWFWFFGATVLVQIPSFTKNVIGGLAEVNLAILSVFIIGISVGSLLCHRLSSGRIEIGLVPFGSIGMSLFIIDLFLASPSQPLGIELTLGAFLAAPGIWRILFDMGMLGIFSGLFIVPLFALVQHRSPPERRARIIAGNSIVNALFMVVAGVMATVLLGSGFTIPQLFLVTGILNIIVAIYIYSLVPEFLLRFFAWIGVNLIYKLNVRGLKNVPEEGAVLIVCNHVSYMDPPILGSALPRLTRFVMYHKIYKNPLLGWVFRTAKAIPIASQKEDKVLMHKAFDEVDNFLREGEMVCIFPEGKLTPDGSIQTFLGGVDRILERRQVVVVPVAIKGLWGGLFSKKDQGLSKRPRRFLKRVDLVIGKSIPIGETNSQKLQQKVQQMYDAI